MINSYLYERKLKKLQRLLNEKYNQYLSFKKIYESNNKNVSEKVIVISDPEIIRLLDLASVDVINILKEKKSNFDYLNIPDDLRGQTIEIGNYDELINALHTIIEGLRFNQ